MIISRGEIQSDLNSHLNEMKAMQKLVDHMLNKDRLTDDLWFTFITATRDHQAYPKTSAFEILQSIGLDIIRNDTLRREITDIYQLSLQRIVDRGDYNLKYDIESSLEPFVKQYLEINENAFSERKLPGGEVMKLYEGKIRNYESFVSDRSLLRELQVNMLERSNKISLHDNTLRHLDRVVNMIDKELSG